MSISQEDVHDIVCKMMSAINLFKDDDEDWINSEESNKMHDKLLVLIEEEFNYPEYKQQNG